MMAKAPYLFCSTMRIECNILDKYQKRERHVIRMTSTLKSNGNQSLLSYLINSSGQGATALFVAPASTKLWKRLVKSVPWLHSMIISQWLFLKNPDEDFIGQCCELRELKIEIREENFNEPNLEFNMLNDQYSND